jgi:hypothetical protein
MGVHVLSLDRSIAARKWKVNATMSEPDYPEYIEELKYFRRRLGYMWNEMANFEAEDYELAETYIEPISIQIEKTIEKLGSL